MKNNVCVYLYLNHFAVQWKLIQYCKSTILQKKKIPIALKQKNLNKLWPDSDNIFLCPAKRQLE